MNDNVLLITGGSRGIGAATALCAAKQRFKIAITYKRDEAAAQSVVEAIAKAGGQAIAIKGDMGVESDVERTFSAVDRQLGRLSCLVYNCGVTGKSSRVEDVTTATLREVMDVNVLGAFWCARAAIPRISKNKGGRGGAIVLISSVAAEIGSAGEYVWYAASKGAIDTMTIGLARELVGDGIRVNAVAPGLIATGIHEPGRLERVAPMVPMKRPGDPDEIAQSVVFLLSEQSSYTTGAILRVTGGR